MVLAGGLSRRLGRDKATLVWAGETLACRAARRLAAVVGEVVVADRGRGVVPGLASLPDGPGRGPAAALLGAAAARPGRPLLALACDLPLVPVALLADLLALAGDLALPRWEGGLEPLCARYGPAALAELAREVAAGRLAPHRLAIAPHLAVSFLEGPRLARHGEPARLFRNLNTPEDLRPDAEGIGSPP